MAFDSQSTKSPSWITGTMPLGLHASSAGSDSTCSNRRSSSAQVHSTLRTLIDEARPSTLSVMKLLLAFEALDPAVDNGHDHGRRGAAAVVGPDLDHRLTGLVHQSGIPVAYHDVIDAGLARGGLAALGAQVRDAHVARRDPFATAEVR